MKERLKDIGTVLAILAVFFAAYCYIDSRYALCEEVKRLERRLEYKIQNDVLMGMQQRAWQIESKYPDIAKAPEPTQQQMRELRHGLEMQKEKVKRLEGR